MLLDAAAQALADQGNTRGALKILLKSDPPALYDNTLHDMVINIYPQQAVPGTNPQVAPDKEEVHTIICLCNYPLDKLQQHFTSIKTGKGMGPF
eukprot:9327071-Ditylum_brightwellii.AAC.1